MVGAVGNSQGQVHGPGAQGHGKRAEAVGHQAKAAVTAAFEAGAEVPGNAQGLAASAIARGIDPASLFAARVEGQTPPAPEGGGAEPVSVTEDVVAEPVSGDIAPDEGTDPVAGDGPASDGGVAVGEPEVTLPEEDPLLALFGDTDPDAAQTG